MTSKDFAMRFSLPCSVFCASTAIAVCMVAGLATSAMAAGPKVPESLLRAANGKTQRVIIMMAAPEQGGQQEAFNRPESYIAQTLGVDAGAVSGIGSAPLVVTNVSAQDLRKLQRSESVLQVFPDRLMKTSLPQSTELLDVPLVWQKQTRGSGVTVAVLDTGLQTAHPFVKDRVVAEACFSSTDANQNSTSLCGNGQGEEIGPGASEACDYQTVTSNCVHGTHVAGIVAGVNGDAKGVALNGVAPEAGLVAVKVFSRFDGEAICGKGTKTCISAWTSDILKGLLYVEGIAREKNVVAINMSLGSGKHAQNCDGTSAYTDVVKRLHDSGIAVIAAAGNESYDQAIAEPACLTNVIAVAATKKDGKIDTSYSNASKQVRIAAPGSQILSSAADGYYKLDGTSMAAPHVAGMIALLKAQNPDASVDQLLETIRKTGKSVTDPRNGVKMILPNAEAAMLALAGAAPAPDEPKPDQPKQPDEPKQPDQPKQPEPDPRLAACGPVCIEEGKDLRRIIFILAKGQAVTPQTIAALQKSFGEGAKVEDIGDGKLLVQLPVQPKADDVDRARRKVGDDTRVIGDDTLKTMDPGQTIKIQ